MEYQQKANLLDNTPNQPSKFTIKNWVEISEESRGTYSVNGQINFKTPLLRSSLCNYSDTYIPVKRNISVINTADAGASNTNKKK